MGAAGDYLETFAVSFQKRFEGGEVFGLEMLRRHVYEIGNVKTALLELFQQFRLFGKGVGHRFSPYFILRASAKGSDHFLSLGQPGHATIGYGLLY